MEVVAVFQLEAFDVLLCEIQSLEIEVLQVVIEESLAELRIKRETGEMAVLQHDRHLSANLVKIRLLSDCQAGNHRYGYRASCLSEPENCHEVQKR